MKKVLLVGLLALICGACQSSTSHPIADASTAAPSSTPTSVTETTSAGRGDHTAEDAALADGVITREEAESLYLGYIDCLSLAGVRGKVAFDLDVSPDLGSSLYLPDDTDPSGTRLTSKIAPCDDSIAAATVAYAAKNPSTDTVRTKALFACLDVLSPEFSAGFSLDLPYEELRADVLSSPAFVAFGQGGADAAGAAQRCAEINNGPWRQIPVHR